MFDIGIIGGMGPQACSSLFDLIVKNTVASKDQEHPSIAILNDTKIPDRSEFILGHSKANPINCINKDIEYLFTMKTYVVGIACNTSHYFYDDIKKYDTMKILNMPELTLRYCQKRGIKKIILLSTLGTINSKIYENQSLCDAEIIYPEEEEANKIHELIYKIKSSSSTNLDSFVEQTQSIVELVLEKAGYFEKKTSIILGCTELSLLTNRLRSKCDLEIIDPLELLAYSLILESGHRCKTNKHYDFDIIGKLNGSSK